MFERFTARARKVVVLAQNEARSFNHNHIGPEHLLLGLLAGEGVAARALGSLKVTLDEVREQVKSVVGYGEGETSERLPFTPRSKKILEQALQEALALEHDYIGTEHLLLGLVRESEGAAAPQVLSNLGVDPDKVRREVVRTLASGRSQRSRRATSSKTIEDWVGQRVSVAVENMGEGKPGRFKCILEGADARGIVVSYQSNASKMTRFYPWHAVSYIKLSKSEDSGKPPRRAGFSSA